MRVVVGVPGFQNSCCVRSLFCPSPPARLHNAQKQLVLNIGMMKIARAAQLHHQDWYLRGLSTVESQF